MNVISSKMLSYNLESVWFRNCTLIVLLVSICTIGDKLITLSYPSPIFRALADNVTHGLVGILSWALVTNLQHWHEIILCGFLASALDIDHFIMASSFKFSDAVNLSHRPPFHNSLLLLGINIGIFIVEKVINFDGIQRLSWIFAVAWMSHHIRDGHRRGLWFGYFTIPPYSQWFYIALVGLLPLLTRCWINRTVTPQLIIDV